MTSDESPAGGGCGCGAVRFEARGAPKFIARCHCRDCRKATAAAYSTWVGWADEQIEWSGEERALYASSDDVSRGFCADCGTPLSYQGVNWPGETHLLIGAFDEEERFTPNGDVFDKEKLAWVKV